MKRTPIVLSMQEVPAQFQPFIADSAVFDSSCSPMARVYFIDKGPGFYLKKAPKGALEKEVALTEFFHQKGFCPQVLAYESAQQDWMLTQRIPGEDCIDPMYLSDPQRLCDTTATLLRMLHDTDCTGCPVHRTADYQQTARHNFLSKAYDVSLFPDNWSYATPEAAWQVVQSQGKYLQSDTLLHGDYCLPNILLDNWQFSGFIDLDSGGIGDRHMDLFWGMWSLQFNLKTDRYRQRFLDVYGMDRVCPDIFPVIAAFEVFQ